MWESFFGYTLSLAINMVNLWSNNKGFRVSSPYSSTRQQYLKGRFTLFLGTEHFVRKRLITYIDFCSLSVVSTLALVLKGTSIIYRSGPWRHFWQPGDPALTLYATGCAKSHDKIKYCTITLKNEIHRNFPFIYCFFILHSMRLFNKIRNNFKFIKKTMPKTLGNLYLK